jgi:glucuronate isomerase
MGRRARAGVAERDIYASYITEGFWKRIEARRPGLVYQFSLGAEPLPFETASRINQRTLAFLAEALAKHPGLRFQCFLSSSHANQTLCTISRELPNLSLAGYWWHNFFPTFIARVISERLDMLSTARQVGFFSDAYTLEWSYAKVILVRRVLSGVLADKILAGQYDRALAIDTARRILFDSPRGLLGMEPAVTPVRSSGGLKTRRPRGG